MSILSLLPTVQSDFWPAESCKASLSLIDDDELVNLLGQASQSELDGIVEILIKKGGLTCQLKDLDVYRRYQPNHRFYSNDIAAEIQNFGGHTIVNVIRGRGVPYGEIVRDVAKKLRVRRSGSTEEIEAKIQYKILGEYWEGLTVSERSDLLNTIGIENRSSAISGAAPLVLVEGLRSSGFAAYKASVIIANAVAKAALGHGLSLAANASITKALSVFLGPLGWSIAGVSIVRALGSEAYRVTIPCVLQISMIRRAISFRQRRRQRIGRLRVLALITGLILVVVVVRLIYNP
jgi:uncharacterized protein YaaW (UPF0174 family)